MLLRYTDGASWIGNQLQPSKEGLYFRGGMTMQLAGAADNAYADGRWC